MYDEDNSDAYLMMFFVIVLMLALTMTSCTVSFTNISAGENSKDLLDENLKASSDFSPTVPLKL